MTNPIVSPPSHRRGVLLALAASAAFASVGVFSQLAFAAGTSVPELVHGRFLLGAAALWLIVLAARRPRAHLRPAMAALALGVLYGAHATLLAGGYARLDAGLVDMIFLLHPAFIVVAAVWLGRDRWRGRTATAVAIALTGSAVALGGIDLAASGGAVALPLGAAIIYAAFVLLAAPRLTDTDPLVFTAWTVTGAALAVTATGAATGHLGAGSLAGLPWVAAVGMVGTALAPAALLVAIAQIGPARASVLGAIEPALTSLFALAAFGDLLTPAQIAGGVLVIASAVLLEWPTRRRVTLRSSEPSKESIWTSRRGSRSSRLAVK